MQSCATKCVKLLEYHKLYASSIQEVEGSIPFGSTCLSTNILDT